MSSELIRRLKALEENSAAQGDTDKSLLVLLIDQQRRPAAVALFGSDQGILAREEGEGEAEFLCRARAHPGAVISLARASARR